MGRVGLTGVTSGGYGAAQYVQGLCALCQPLTCSNLPPLMDNPAKSRLFLLVGGGGVTFG